MPWAPPISTDTGRETKWASVLKSRFGNGALAEPALQFLCDISRPAVLHYISHCGFSREQTSLLTTGFLSHLLTGNYLRYLQAHHSHFRAFISHALREFLANDWAKASAGMNSQPGIHSLFPLENFPPDNVFDRAWAASLIARASSILESEASSCGKLRLYTALKPCLPLSPTHSAPLVEIAAELHTSPNSLQIALQQFQLRFQSILAHLVSDTLSSSTETTSELNHLLMVI